MVKVKPNFQISDTIVIDFDQQVWSHHSSKDLLRYHRDNKAMKMEEISVTDDGMPPGKDWPWISFLANCRNKTDLVAYLSKKLINSNCLMDLKEIFYVSFEVQLHQVTHKYT